MKSKLLIALSALAAVVCLTFGMSGCVFTPPPEDPVYPAYVDENSKIMDGVVYSYHEETDSYTCSNITDDIGEDVVILSQIEGKPVTSIGENAFYGCTSLTSISIPDSVTFIGNDAFEGCTSLESVTIGSGVTSIGHYAFKGCTSLTSITIPDKVTSIGGNAFEGCTILAGVSIGNGVTFIGGGAFGDCTSLKSVTIPDSVTTIGVGTFGDCTSLESVSIGNGLTYIGELAFRGCTSLTSVTFKNKTSWNVCINTRPIAESITVDDPAENATLLTDTYCGYYNWQRTDVN